MNKSSWPQIHVEVNWGLNWGCHLAEFHRTITIEYLLWFKVLIKKMCI